MRRSGEWLWLLLAAACSGAPATSEPQTDGAGGAIRPIAGDDAAESDAACFVAQVGVFGTCLAAGDCAALGNHVGQAGSCADPAAECCTRAPSVADNPPIPPGWRLMQQAEVTAPMTAWAVAILHDPADYPLFSTSTRAFGGQQVLARVEWHPPDFQNGAVHRGVTLYEPDS